MRDSSTACTLTAEQQFRVHVVQDSDLLEVTSLNSNFKGGTLYNIGIIVFLLMLKAYWALEVFVCVYSCSCIHIPTQK